MDSYNSTDELTGLLIPVLLTSGAASAAVIADAKLAVDPPAIAMSQVMASASEPAEFWDADMVIAAAQTVNSIITLAVFRVRR
jgi:hypothetical protein